MSEVSGDAPTVTETVGDPPIVTVTEAPPEKKKRQARPYWLLVPVADGQTYAVHVIVGKRQVLKLLEKLEIDAADPRLPNIKLLRAAQVPLTMKSQTIFKFGASEEDDEMKDDDDEVI